MQDKHVIEIQFEPETAFMRDNNSQAPSSSAMSVGKFLDAQTQESWLGKCDGAMTEAMTKTQACREKLANEIYGYYGIVVPRLRISRQPIPQAIKDVYEIDMDAGYHVMSRWLDRFDVYGYLPEFKGGQASHLLQVTVENQSRSLAEQGLGTILAVAHWLNDIDVMNPSGKNVGYQLKLDTQGQLYAKSCKIDPGYAFSDFFDGKTATITPVIQLSTQNHRVAFEQLPQATQQEYLLTVKKIIATSDTQMAAFFAHPETKAAVENDHVKQMHSFVSIAALVERLKQRRDGLAKLHSAALKTVQAMVLPSAPKLLPAILERLYCQAKLQYETEVKDKAAFYVPLDVTLSAQSDARVPMQDLWTNFLNLPKASSPTLTTTTNTTATTVTTQTTTSTLTNTALTTTAAVAMKTPAIDQKLNASVLLLLGASGGGKSLATQLLVNQLWEAFLKNPNSPIPLRVELKQFSERTVGQCLINTLLDEYRYSPTELRMLQTYRFVFIFDGYDEMAGQAKINLLTKHQATEIQYGKWQAQFILTCRESYFQGLDQSVFHPVQGSSGLAIRYLSSLTPAHQVDYLMRYREAHPQKQLPDYATLLKENPNLHELLGNPFLLRIFRDALPRWQADHPKQPLTSLTRYALYTAFMDHWFASEAVRLSMIEGKCLPDILPERFLDFSLRLAFEMHVQKVDEVNAEATDQQTWVPFFSDQHAAVSEARAGCPLRRLGQSRYSFVHKSFLEYFVARTLWQALENNDVSLWNQRLLPEAWEILQFLVAHWRQKATPDLQARLWHWIQGSKTSDQQSIAAANAITVLNHGGLSFIGEYGDLAGVKIPRADLQNAFLDHTCFRGANLKGVNLARAFLRGTDLTKADLTEAQFGEFPSIQCNDEVNCVAYSPDGKFLAMGVGKTVEVWEVLADEPKKIVTFEQHEKPVTSVAFDPSGARIVSGSWDTTLRVWAAQTGQPLATLQGHTNSVTSCAFDPAGLRIVSGSQDHTLRVWAAHTGQVLATLQGHTDRVSSCAFDPVGSRIVSGSWDKTLRVWEAQTGQVLATLQGHTGTVTSCAFDPTGSHIVSGSFDTTLRVWEAQTGQSLVTLQGHTNQVTSCAFDPAGLRIVSGSGDTTLRVWAAQTGQVLATLQGHTSYVTSCAFDPAGLRIVSGGGYGDNTLRVWAAKTGQPLATLQGHTRQVTSCAFDPAGSRIVSGSFDKTLRVWAAQTGQPLATLQGHTKQVTSCAFDPTGKRIVSGSWDHTLRLWEAQTGQVLATLQGHTDIVTSCAFDPAGTRIVSASEDKTLRVWAAQTGQVLATLQGHTQEVTSCAFDPAGNRIVSGGGYGDKTLRVWEAQTGQVLATLQGHTDKVTSCAFDPAGLRIVSGSGDKTLRVWEAHTGKPLATLQGHTSIVTSCAFDPTGSRIVSGSKDKTLRLWEAHTGKPLATLQGHTSEVSSCAFDPTGTRIVSGSWDYSLLVWCSVNLDGTLWQVIWRATQHPVLIAPDAFLHQATLSSMTQKLLTQRGATQAAPDYKDYRQSFWAKPLVREKNKSLLSTPSTSTAPIVPAPLQTSPSSTSAPPAFEVCVLQCVKALKTALLEAGESLDSQVACTFISTFLRAIRKGTLDALKAAPGNYGIPTRWVTWLTHAFETDPMLKMMLKNPHPHSTRFELELLQVDLSILLQRYSANPSHTTLPRQNTAQHPRTDSNSSSSSSHQKQTNKKQKKNEKCFVM